EKAGNASRDSPQVLGVIPTIRSSPSSRSWKPSTPGSTTGPRIFTSAVKRRGDGHLRRVEARSTRDRTRPLACLSMELRFVDRDNAALAVDGSPVDPRFGDARGRCRPDECLKGIVVRHPLDVIEVEQNEVGAL